MLNSIWAFVGFFGTLTSLIFLLIPLLIEQTPTGGLPPPAWGALPFLGLFLTVLAKMKGVQVDLTQKRLRAYTSFWGWKYGKWRSLHDFHKIVVVIDRYTISEFSVSEKSWYDASDKSYDLILRGKKIGDNLMLEEFDKYRQAERKLAYYRKLLGLKTRDEFGMELKMRRGAR